MALAGKDFKIQVNGTSGSWTEVSISGDASPSISADLLDVTQFGDDAMRRIQGLVDTGLELTVYTDTGQSTNSTGPVADLEDSVINGTEIQVEFSPDGNASGGPTDVYAFTGIVESEDFSSSVDSEQTKDYSIQNSNGSKVITSGTFS